MAESKPMETMAIKDVDKKNIVMKFSQGDIQKTKKNANKKLPYYTSVHYSRDGQNHQLVLKTGVIELVGFSGVPRNGKDENGKPFYATEKDRAKFEIPYDENQPACVELMNLMKSIDADVLKNQKKLFEDVTDDIDSADYSYSELFKELDKKKKKRMQETGTREYSKLRTEITAFAKDKTKDDKNDLDIKTTLFVMNEGKYEKVPVSSLADIETYASRGSQVRCILIIDRVWASRSKLGNSCMYGIKVKCAQIYVVKRGAGSQMSTQFEGMLLDDEESVEPKKSKVADEKKPKMITGKTATSKKSSEDTDDSDKEELSDKETKSKKQDETKKDKPKKKSSDDESDDSSDERKTKKDKPKKKSDDESDEDSDDDTKKISVKKVVSKKKKSDEEDDD